jgi:hypothetical protein
MTTKRDKIIEEARTRYEYASEAWAPIYALMSDDLAFSDPTCLKQWPDKVKREREMDGRPCLTFDQIGQYVRQIINQARRNKPALKFLPVDDNSDVELCEVLQGLARQTEYESKAEVAYITSLDHAVRGGLGFFRLITEEMQGSEVVGQQCAKIMRVVDVKSIKLDPDFTEMDGSDSGWGFAEETYTREAFKKAWPKAALVDWDSQGWFGKDHIRVCEYFRVVETTTNKISVGGKSYSEEEYWQAAAADPTMGEPVPHAAKSRKVEWFKLSGEEVLEQSEFPAEFVPIFPVIGNESWEEGKRRLGGIVRPVRDGQVAYNFERNGEIEAVAIGPKAPWVAPAEAIEGYEAEWKNANRGNISVLHYNSIDEQGNPINAPTRINPAGVAAGWVTLAERSKADIQSGMGMFSASVGNNPNNQSGRAVLALQDKAEIGSFHYIDNLALSISHMGRVLTQVWPRIYDQAQIVRILGEDDESTFVQVDPQQQRGYQKQQGQDGREVVTINPGAGRYDARAVVGPAYSTRQTEAAAEISELVNGNPQMLSLIGDVWVKMRNFPEAEKLAKRFKAMLPPQVAALEKEDEGQAEIPPEVEQAMQQAGQEIQALREQNQQLMQEVQSKAQADAAKYESAQTLEMIRSQTQLQLAEMNNDAKQDVEELKGMIAMLIQQMQPPPQLAAAVSEDMAE